MQPPIFLALFSFLLLSSCQCLNNGNSYSAGENIDIWVNRVGPYNNPQEFYLFHALPFCKNELNDIGKRESLGESILGYELRKFISFSYLIPVAKQSICEMKLDERSVAIFKYAIDRQYWYQLFADNLPMWGIVGDKVENGAYRLYTHFHFDISYHNDRIIEINMTNENAKELTGGQTFDLTYSIQFIQSSSSDHLPDYRFRKYLNSNDEIAQWFHLLNSFILVLFLFGLVTLILLKTLKKEFSYSDDDSEEDIMEDSGWKLLQREVFRRPPCLMLFCSIIGSGFHLFFSTFAFFIFAILSPLYTFRGSLLSTFITCYLFLAFIAGYSSVHYYQIYRGALHWLKTCLLSASFVPFVLFFISLLLNLTAKSYASLSHIPFSTFIVVVGLWWGMVAEVAVGALICRHINKPITNGGSSGNLNTSVIFNRSANLTPRLIPKKGISLNPILHVILSGILPFSSIFIELHLLFQSIFSYRYYFTFGYLFCSFFILSFAVCFVSVISIYFVLNNEDHRWHWRSFSSGASLSLYVFLYGIYFYYYHTNMSGFLQFVLYFGDVFIISFLLAVLCGSLSFYAANLFIHRIYNFYKSE